MLQVFIRELISNASDALEKFRYMTLTGAELENNQRPLEINITTDKDGKSITIQVSSIFFHVLKCNRIMLMFAGLGNRNVERRSHKQLGNNRSIWLQGDT